MCRYSVGKLYEDVSENAETGAITSSDVGFYNI